MAGVQLGENTARALVRLLNQGKPYTEDPRKSTPRADEDPLFFRNDSGEEVPPYACMKVIDAIKQSNRYLAIIQKPDNTGGPFIFNGPYPVAVEKTGVAQNTPVVRAAYSTGSPTTGSTWGPISDWECVSDGQPALVVFGVVEPSEILKGFQVVDGNTCDSLQPGVYQGVAGATFAPGESGPVVVDGETHTATNTTECEFKLGDRILVAVSPDCSISFTGCKCCDAGTEGEECCATSIAVCICGEEKILKVDGGSASWSVAECCCCSSTATFAIEFACNPEGTPKITATWEYSCGAISDSGNFNSVNFDGLCSDADTETSTEVTADGCDIPIPIRFGNFVEGCTAVPCTDEPCESCISLLDWTTDEPNPADIGVTALTMTPDPVCNGDTFTVEFTVTNSTGGLWEFTLSDPLYLAYENDPCTDSDPAIEFVSATASGVDTPTATILDRQVEWRSGTIAAGGTATFAVTFRLNCCLESALEMEIAPTQGRRTSITFECVSCP